MHCYEIHEAVFLNCENHDPSVRDSGPWVGLIWPLSQNDKNAKIISSVLLQYCSDCYVHDVLLTCSVLSTEACTHILRI